MTSKGILSGNWAEDSFLEPDNCTLVPDISGGSAWSSVYRDTYVSTANHIRKPTKDMTKVERQVPVFPGHSVVQTVDDPFKTVSHVEFSDPKVQPTRATAPSSKGMWEKDPEGLEAYKRRWTKTTGAATRKRLSDTMYKSEFRK